MYDQKLHFKFGFSTEIIADYFSFFELSEGFQWAHARWLCLSPCHSLCYSGLRLTALGQNSIIFYGNQPRGPWDKGGKGNRWKRVHEKILTKKTLKDFLDQYRETSIFSMRGIHGGSPSPHLDMNNS
jgi:hypothetical protein